MDYYISSTDLFDLIRRKMNQHETCNWGVILKEDEERSKREDGCMRSTEEEDIPRASTRLEFRP